MLFGLVMSAIWSALAWLVRSILIKIVFYVALFYFTSEAMGYLSGKLSGVALDAGGFMGSVAPAVQYFLAIFRIDVGLPAIISAYVLRFSIRRMPVVG